jgi:hypothetical protein
MSSWQSQYLGNYDSKGNKIGLSSHMYVPLYVSKRDQFLSLIQDLIFLAEATIYLCRYIFLRPFNKKEE